MLAHVVDGFLQIYGRLGYHPGKWRVVASLYAHARPNWREKRLCRRYGCSFECDLHDYDQREIYYMGPEPYQVRYLRKFIQPGWTVIDVGANCGWYSLLMSKWVGHSGRVFAFEPSPRSLPVIRRNLELNPGARVFLQEMALGDTLGSCAMRVPEPRHLGMDQVCSGSSIRMATLDSFVHSNGVERVDFIKVDIEGFEPHFLRGAEGTLRQFHPPMLVEINPAPLANFGSSEEGLESRLHELQYDLFEFSWRGIRLYQRPAGMGWYRTVLALPLAPR